MPVFTTNLPSDSDGIFRDIPNDRSMEHTQSFYQIATKSLGLQDLQNGIKGMEIRIWEGFNYKGRLFLLRHNGNSWKGELYYFRDSFSHAGEEGKVSKYKGATAIEKHELKQTSREWKQFVNRLLELEIDKVRDFSLIPEYGDYPDGGGVLIEVAQDKFYKVYRMLTPSARKESVKEARQVVQMLELIDRNFRDKLKDKLFNH